MASGKGSCRKDVGDYLRKVAQASRLCSEWGENGIAAVSHLFFACFEHFVVKQLAIIRIIRG